MADAISDEDRADESGRTPGIAIRFAGEEDNVWEDEGVGRLTARPDPSATNSIPEFLKTNNPV